MQNKKWSLFNIWKFLSLTIVNLLIIACFFAFKLELGFAMIIVTTIISLILSGFGSYISITKSRFKRHGFFNLIVMGKRNITISEIKKIIIKFVPEFGKATLVTYPYMFILDKNNRKLCKINVDFCKDYVENSNSNVKVYSAAKYWLQEIYSINSKIKMDEYTKRLHLIGDLSTDIQNFEKTLNINSKQRMSLFKQFYYLLRSLFHFIIYLSFYILIAVIIYKFI